MNDTKLRTLIPAIQGVILDMDGVLWRDNVAIVDIPKVLAMFDQQGIKVTFVTNNATKSVEQYQKKLASFGATVNDWQIINSPMAATIILGQQFPDGGPVYIVGEDGLVQHLAAKGFYPSEENVLAVVVGLDTHFTYDKLHKASSLIRNGSLFIGTNPDPTYPTPDGLCPGGGAIIAAIETAAGKKAIIAGKPEPAMLKVAMQRMDTSPANTLVIGDRPETDILGGQRAGCRTALVLSGVTSWEEAHKWTPPPDLIIPSLDSLFE